MVEKLLMSNSLRMIANDPNATVDQKMLLNIKENPLQCYDDVGVNKIISVVRKLATEMPEGDA